MSDSYKPLHPTPARLWSLLALGSTALALASLLLPAWLDLDPCHLCIFQRLLFMLMAPLAALAALAARWPSVARRAMFIAGLPFLAAALTGGGVAAWQSWLQLQPPASVSCVGGQMGLIERLVEWLGAQWPALFLATGFCEDAALVILGLSLANWALAGFLLAALVAAAVLWRCRNA